jgi:hypothetical protein
MSDGATEETRVKADAVTQDANEAAPAEKEVTPTENHDEAPTAAAELAEPQPENGETALTPGDVGEAAAPTEPSSEAGEAATPTVAAEVPGEASDEEPPQIAVEAQQADDAEPAAVEAAAAVSPEPSLEAASADESQAGAAEAPTVLGDEATPAAVDAPESGTGDTVVAEPAAQAEATADSSESPAAEEPAPEPTVAAGAATATVVPEPERNETTLKLLAAMAEKSPIEGKVIGWNRGGFHIAVEGVSAFCPRSMMEIGNPRRPESYLDQSFEFRISEIDESARRVVVSRQELLQEARKQEREQIRSQLEVGAVLDGRVDSSAAV